MVKIDIIFRRDCPNCGVKLEYTNKRSFHTACLKNKLCIKCRSNTGIHTYDCVCGKIITYKRKSDFDKAVKNKIKCSDCHKKNYVINNPEKVLKTKSKWNTSNNKYYRDKKKNNLNYKISSSMRTKLWRAVKCEFKSGKTIEMLGCSIVEFKKYIENKFDDKMNWDNYATYWEFDHIKPFSYFDLSNNNQLRECFHYTNVQPLNKKLNRKKGKLYVENNTL